MLTTHWCFYVSQPFGPPRCVTGIDLSYLISEEIRLCKYEIYRVALWDCMYKYKDTSQVNN
jgi:hypothetical protein